MRCVYQFVGGDLNGIIIDDLNELKELGNGKFTEPYVENFDGIQFRRELCSLPEIDGYLGPCWDGIRYGGKYASEATEEEKEKLEPYGVVRYESYEVYDFLTR